MDQTNNMAAMTKEMKEVSYQMAALSFPQRNQMLQQMITVLLEQKDAVFAANRRDLERAVANRIPSAVRKRLLFDEKKLNAVIEGIKQLITLPDPINRILMQRELDAELILKQISCPIGVIGIIFEARPDAMVQIASLCIKSGNCAILKGGSETAETNGVLFDVIYRAVLTAGAPQHCLFLATGHDEIGDLLSCVDTVDLIIPRGSNAFVRYIMEHTRIPVLGHADGLCHTYVDRDANPEIAARIVPDAKTQYPAACNATETLLIDRSLRTTLLPELADILRENGVKLRGTKEVCALIPCEPIDEDDFHTEYLDHVISIKLVDGVEEAIAHINSYGSHHTDAIITDNMETAERFLNLVDSAGCYLNCSTRFADGFRYGFGAEVGISTSKIHARGPVGLNGLTTYKYQLLGNGQIVADYADGTKQFHHRDME